MKKFESIPGGKSERGDELTPEQLKALGVENPMQEFRKEVAEKTGRILTDGEIGFIDGRLWGGPTEENIKSLNERFPELKDFFESYFSETE